MSPEMTNLESFCRCGGKLCEAFSEEAGLSSI
jgi:hypothetical protein